MRRAASFMPYVFVLVFALGATLLLPTQAAHADWVSDAWDFVSDWTPVGLATSTLDTLLSPLLRGAVNMMISTSVAIIASLTDGDTLTSTFSSLISGAYPIIRTVHNGVAVPLAQVVLAIFFVMGLVRQLQTMGQHQSGIDLWQFMLVFLMLAFGIVLIQNSLELMVAIYSLITDGIAEVINAGSASSSVSSFATVDEDFDNASCLFYMLLFSAIGVLVSGVCWVVVHVIILARSCQIYVYTAFAPIPLACMVSDSARPIATGFLKRYVATIASGAIIALLLILYSAIVSNWALTTSVVPTDVATSIQWTLGCAGNLIPMVVLAWTVSKSGAWARDMVGL